MFLKGALFYRLENMTYNLGPKLRRIGQQTFEKGMELQGGYAHADTMQPSLRCIPTGNNTFPKSLASDWVAPNAVVVGDVEMGEGSSAWHGTKLRGDTASIRIGRNSLIQDNSRLGTNECGSDAKIEVEDNVYVGANAKIAGNTLLESFAYVGMGSYVGTGSTVQSFGVLAAGAILPDNTTVPSG